MATRKQILDNDNNEILPITDTDAVRNPQSIGGTLEGRLQNIEEDKGHFKGWWPDLATLKAAYTAEEGDSAYVKDASPATTWSIYVYDSTASSNNYWADSGTNADTSNVQTFASGEEVNEVHIVNDVNTGGEHDVLSAEQGKTLAASVKEIIKNTDGEADLDVIDEEGNVLARFENGNFRVKNFDSVKVVANLGTDSVQEFDDTQSYAVGDLVIYEGLLYKFILLHEPGEWDVDEVEQTSVMKSSDSPVNVTNSSNDADLDIKDENYYVLARFKNGHIKTKKFDSENIEKNFVQKDLDIFFNAVSNKQHYDTVSSTTKNLSFPYDLKKNVCFALKADFATFATITIGKGYNAYSGYWFVIDSTNISLYYNQGTTTLSESIAHGLTFSDFVKIVISNIGDDYCRFFIQTKGGQFSYLFEWIFSANGQTFFTTAGTLANVDFIASCSDLKNDIWVFGDSYLGFANPARWPKQLRDMGYSDYLGDGFAGQSSSGAYSDLQRCLSLDVKPKYLVWTLGMNDNDSAWNTTYQQLQTLCESNNITLILATIPTVPSRNKENINTTVRNSGYGYIDFANAVGANSSGVWYNNYLSSDGVHPTTLGAKALATQFIFDFILKY